MAFLVKANKSTRNADDFNCGWSILHMLAQLDATRVQVEHRVVPLNTRAPARPAKPRRASDETLRA